jgi:CDP-diacylglycerol--glycerol-3-phosphate 3-phosphatidyltransferase
MMSDFLDGYLARKFNWVSEWGKIWDPIADKVLINTVLICLSTTNVVPFILVVIFISRDTIVDAYRISAIKKNINVAANLWGKLKTIFQFFALIILLFLFNGQLQENYGYWTWQNGLLIIACLFSIISGIVYVKCFNYKKN